ncbi:MAG: glutamine--fructose-6-phosphate transaminase (isomerizing) [Eubacteriales bacterium]|nr:glutamine--fructose-6-phosphate transaminase (isomerizing) [Clostridia bacterium]MDY5754420.1 glutamine--fructose-6-phosphate transaminase (isomerizing) [Eubacteriales bacterium]
MCGIVGFAGTRQAAPILLDGLEKLEYRGYDSAGLAIEGDGEILVKKQKGRLRVLREATHNGEDLPGVVGIGHTRWATHGEPSDVNSHPHLSYNGEVCIVHNGIIENYIELRNFLISKGYEFASDTDTEVISQLMDYYYHGDPTEAVEQARSHLMGSYALGILFRQTPDRIYAICKDNPLIIGIGEGENFMASDVTAILKYTRRVFRLSEGELAVLTRDGVTVTDSYGEPIEKEITNVTWDENAAEKGGYEHFMIKEILEQPEVIRKTASPRIVNGTINLSLKSISDEDIRGIDKIYIVACGSAYHVGCVAKPILSKLCRLPVFVELASEFKYSDPMVDNKTLTIVISQSGETLDTYHALKEAASRESRIISVVNVVGSTIAMASEDVLFTWAGPEIAVATTKAYSAQLIVMYMLAMYMGRVRGVATEEDEKELIRQLEALPDAVEAILEKKEQVQYLASLFYSSKDIFFLGRNIDYALALEGSLKLKEISYIHSEAYAAGELKHGTISLIERGSLVVALCTYKPLKEKLVSNIKEVVARGAVVIALANEGDTNIEAVADHVIELPKWEELTMPSLAIIPLQLFAYYVASLKGCDIDKPRNLAKSVTVE